MKFTSLCVVVNAQIPLLTVLFLCLLGTSVRAGTPDSQLSDALNVEGLTAVSVEAPNKEAIEPITTPSSNSSSHADASSLEAFIVLPVGLNVGDRNVVDSALVRGFEDGNQAVSFENWLIPLEDVIRALQLQMTPVDGQLELRSAGLITRINPDELKQDPELGLVLSIAEIETRFGIPAEFDLVEYAIRFNPPWLVQRGSRVQRQQLPVLTEGLPLVGSPDFSLTAIGQQVNITGGDRETQYEGELTGVGTILGGSWFVRARQSDLVDSSTWRLDEAQYLRQTDATDYAIGSQPTFWRSQSASGYWGATTIQRWGYEPSTLSSLGGFSPSQRLQADVVGRTISGEAEPNTLVQLVQGFRTNVIAETLVDSSGIYRFENIPATGGRYEVLLYPDGQLTAQPEIRDATFSTLPSQLPSGASAMVVSAGLERQGNSSFLGDFADFRGGVAYRRGISEDLTLGVGAIYDESVMGLGELFYQPTNFPLQVAASLLVGGEDELDLNASVRFQPSNRFRIDLSTDRLSSRFGASWQLVPGFTLRTHGNTRDDAIAAGFTYFRSNRSFSTYASLDYDTNSNLRWSLFSRLNQLQLNSRGNELSTASELSYRLSRGFDFSTGHLLRLGYATNSSRNGDELLTLGWSYRSPYQALDGRNFWEFGLGYGIGSQGSGLIASAATAILPGLVVRARYEGISVTSSADTFRIELMPFLNTQAGIRSSDSRIDHFRRDGGLWIQPFLDSNNNGQQDQGEEVHTQDSDLLLILNNHPVALSRPEIHSNGIFMRVPPGTYRLDLDPAGYPLDWSPSETAYAVEVAAGSYTPISIPFMLSYTVMGAVMSPAGEVVSGAKVEAVSTTTGRRALSITNGAGIFVLETLQQGNYTLLINGVPAQPGILTLDANSTPFQELDLIHARQTDHREVGSVRP